MTQIETIKALFLGGNTILPPKGVVISSNGDECTAERVLSCEKRIIVKTDSQAHRYIPIEECSENELDQIIALL